MFSFFKRNFIPVPEFEAINRETYFFESEGTYA